LSLKFFCPPKTVGGIVSPHLRKNARHLAYGYVDLKKFPGGESPGPSFLKGQFCGREWRETEGRKGRKRKERGREERGGEEPPN